MKQNSTLKKFLIKVLLPLAFVASLFYAITVSSLIAQLQSASLGIFGSIQYAIIQHPVNTVNNFVTSFFQFATNKEMAQVDQRQLELLALYKAELEEAYRQIIQLKQLVELDVASNEYEITHATVIYRPAELFSHSLLINVGENQGIQPDLAVINHLGLIGKIESVNANTAIVRLLTTQQSENRVAVKIQISPNVTAEALLQRYNSNKQVFELVLLDTNATISVGNTVITSGLGGVFPAGLLVGTVSEVEQLSNAITVNVFVTPSVNFSNFDYVSVIKRPIEFLP